MKMEVIRIIVAVIILAGLLAGVSAWRDGDTRVPYVFCLFGIGVFVLLFGLFGLFGSSDTAVDENGEIETRLQEFSDAASRELWKVKAGGSWEGYNQVKKSEAEFRKTIEVRSDRALYKYKKDN